MTVNMLTNIPLHGMLELAVDIILKNKVGLKISKDELIKLFTYIDGVGMGSPLP